jgi:hypothetical protein
MMTPLQDDQRRQGGETRAENQSKSDRQFLATLAAYRRPLQNDAKIADDDELLRMFREESKGGPGGGRRWIMFLIVGSDGRTIRSTLDDATILKRLKLVGGAIGFMGVTVFGDPLKGNRAPSLQVYSRPLKKGTGVIEKLDKVGRQVTAAIITSLPPMKGAIATEAGE